MMFRLSPTCNLFLHHRSAVFEDDAIEDVQASRFLLHKTFFNVHVFISFATTSTLAATFHRHECNKLCAYEECKREVEHSSFTSCFFSSGSMGATVTRMYKHVKLKVKFSYSWQWAVVLGFYLVHSSVRCLRGSHSISRSPGVLPAIDLAVAEGRLTPPFVV